MTIRSEALVSRDWRAQPNGGSWSPVYIGHGATATHSIAPIVSQVFTVRAVRTLLVKDFDHAPHDAGAAPRLQVAVIVHQGHRRAFGADAAESTEDHELSCLAGMSFRYVVQDGDHGAIPASIDANPLELPFGPIVRLDKSIGMIPQPDPAFSIRRHLQNRARRKICAIDNLKCEGNFHVLDRKSVV